VKRLVSIFVVLLIASLILFGCGVSTPSATDNTSGGTDTQQTTGGGSDNTSQTSGEGGGDSSSQSSESSSGSSETTPVKITWSDILPGIVMEDDMKQFLDTVFQNISPDNEIIAMGFSAANAPYYYFHGIIDTPKMDEKTFTALADAIKAMVPEDRFSYQYSDEYAYISVSSGSDYPLSFQVSYDGGSKSITVGIGKSMKEPQITRFGMDFSRLKGEKWAIVSKVLHSAGIDTTHPLPGKHFEAITIEFPKNSGKIAVNYSVQVDSDMANTVMSKMRDIVGGDYTSIAGSAQTLEQQNYKGIYVSASTMGKGDQVLLGIVFEFQP